MKVRDPETRAEWQEAADGASLMLALDDCRIYGLLTGTPKVNRERCFEILSRAKAIAIIPAPIEALIDAGLTPVPAATPDRLPHEVATLLRAFGPWTSAQLAETLKVSPSLAGITAASLARQGFIDRIAGSPKMRWAISERGQVELARWDAEHPLS